MMSKRNEPSPSTADSTEFNIHHREEVGLGRSTAERGENRLSTDKSSAEFVNAACRTVGAAVAADYVRVVVESAGSSRFLVLGTWPISPAPMNAALHGPPDQHLEWRSIETGDTVSERGVTDVSVRSFCQGGAAAGPISGFAFPIANHYGVQASLGVYFAGNRPDFGRHIRLIEPVVSMLSGFLRAVRREDSLHTECNTQRVLAQIGQVVNASLRIDDIYAPLAKLIRSLLPCDTITVATVDPDEQTRRIDYASSTGLPERWTRTTVTLAGSFEEEVVNAKTSVRVGRHNRSALSGRYQEVADLHAADFRCWLTVPLIWQSKVIGLLNILSKREDAYRDEDLGTADEIGAEISGALTSARLYQTVQRDAYERSIIAELSRVLTSSVRIEEVYPLFADRLRHLIPFDRIAIDTLDASTGMVGKSFTHGAEVPAWRVRRNFPPGPLTDLVTRSGQGIIRFAGEVYAEDSAHPYEDNATNVGLLSAMAVPLTVHNKPVGAMCLRAYAPRAFEGRHLELADRVGAQIAGSITAFQYQSALGEQIDERMALETFIHGALIADSIDKLVTHTLETASRMVRFDRMVLGLTDPDVPEKLTLHVRGTELPGEDSAGRLGALDGEPQRWDPKGYVSAFYGPISDVPGLSPHHAGCLTKAGLTGWMHAPLTVNGNVLGYLAVQGRPRNGYAARHFGKFERVASLLAHVVQRSMPSLSPGLPNGSIEPVDRPFARARSGSTDVRSVTGATLPVKLLVVGDYPVCRTGLSTILGGSNIELVGATNWAEALSTIMITVPDVVLADAHPDDPTLPFLQRETRNASLPPVLVILEHHERSDVLRYLAAGASGIIAKESTRRQMAGAVEQIAAGRSVVELPLADVSLPGVSGILPPVDGVLRADLQHVTARDREILKGVASGRTNSELATELHLATGTVRNRLAQLYRILDVNDRGAAVYASVRLGLID